MSWHWFGPPGGRAARPPPPPLPPRPPPPGPASIASRACCTTLSVHGTLLPEPGGPDLQVGAPPSAGNDTEVPAPRFKITVRPPRPPRASAPVSLGALPCACGSARP